MKKHKNKQSYYNDNMPVPDGHPSYHRPRRNYWGNLIEEDIFREEIESKSFYDYSDYDSEDDHSSYYDHESYI